MKGKVSAIILGAGQSKRMGVPKLALPFGGSTVIQCTVQNVLNSRVDETLVILGCEAEKVKTLLQGTKARLVINSDYEKGMLTSVIAGVKATSLDSQSIMLIPADQPMIRSSTINLILETFQNCNKGIAVPVYKGKHGHPAIISLKYRDELFRLSGEGARRLMSDHPLDVLEVPLNREEIIADIDTPEDYHRAVSFFNTLRSDFT